MRTHIIVIGDGPAGTAAATACAESGLPVTVVAPRPQAAWRHTYGAWLDELGPDVPVAHRWDDPVLIVDDAAPISLGRAFGVIDNDALQADLVERGDAAGLRWRSGVARHAAFDAEGVIVRCADDSEIEAGMVIDASGHRGALVRHGVGREPAWQTAYGIVARLDRSPVPPAGMWFMDWRTAPLAGLAGGLAAPTFCYAMDLGDGRVFAQETALAARPSMPLNELHGRLLRRLDGCGSRVTETLAVERVRFPMGGPLPDTTQRVVAYGAAAGMVHPATGFQVAAALRRASALGAALARALDTPAATPESAAAAGWAAVWPDDLVRQRELHAYGLEVLLSLDAASAQNFFRAFFSLPTPEWSAYVSGAASSRHLARIMLATVRRCPPSLMWRALRPSLGRDGLALARTVLAGADPR